MVADLFGWLGLAGTCGLSLVQTRRAMLALQLFGGPCFLLHWALQGESIAAGACALSMLLTLLALAMDGPRERLARGTFLLALLPMAALVWAGWGGWPSAFAALGTALVCLARWQADPARMRALMLASAVPWLVHDLALFSLPGMAADLLMLAQGALLLWRQPASLAVMPATCRPWKRASSSSFALG